MLARKHAQMDQNEVFMIAALIAGHASFIEQGGFRQKDIKFLMDMFSNWVDFTLEDRVLQVHNTQVMRYLNSLVKQGYATGKKGSATPRYQLTRAGLIRLVEKLAKRPPLFPFEHSYFVLHILATYRAPIQKLILEANENLPSAQKVEIDSLFGLEKTLQEHIDFISKELEKLNSRIADSKKVTEMTQRARKDRKSTETLVKQIEENFPYDLNTQKPLTQFYREMPAFMRDWILDVAIPKRAEQVWEPLLESLKVHKVALEKLRESLKAK